MTESRTPSPTPREAPEDPFAPPAEATASSGGDNRTVWLLAALAGVMAALAITFALLWWLEEGESERQEVLDTAEQYAVDFATYDYRTLKEHREHLLSFSTESFAKTVKSQVAKFDDILVENKPVSKATVVRRGLAELDGDRAVVILFVDQKITNKSTPKPRIDRSRMVLELSDVDGEWKLDGLRLE